MAKAPRLNSLLAGNARFQTVFKQNRDSFLELLKGQSPRALYIGCADSRVVPNFIIDAGPGEVFVVRNVGAVVPAPAQPDSLAIAAAVEFAVFHLDVPRVVICAHDHCGAMKGILGGVEATSPLGQWLVHAAADVPKVYSNGEKLPLATFTELFVRMQYGNLLEHEIAHRASIERGVKFSAWVYNPENGRIREMADDGSFHEHVAPEQSSEVWQK